MNCILFGVAVIKATSSAYLLLLRLWPPIYRERFEYILDVSVRHDVTVDFGNCSKEHRDVDKSFLTTKIPQSILTIECDSRKKKENKL